MTPQRVILAATPAYGHVGPIRTIGAELVQRGYDVTVVSGSRFRKSISRTGARFVPLVGVADWDPRRVRTLYPESSLIPPGEAWTRFEQRAQFIEPLPIQFKIIQELLAECEDEPVVVIADHGFGGAHLPAIGVPGQRPTGLITIGVGPIPFTSIDTAPYGTGLPPDSSAAGRIRNRTAHAQLRATVHRANDQYLEQVLRGLGARGPVPPLNDLGRMSDRYLQLSIPSVEYPRSDAPAGLRFIGALPTGARGGGPVPDWWGELATASKVIAVSQGTVANRDFTELIEPAVRGLAKLEDVLVVVTLGRPYELRGLPPNVRVAEFVPFEALLPYADVLVTNGGYGGMQQALSHGTPMVLAGDADDKRESTARVAWSGAAINLGTQRPTPAAIRSAVSTVLGEPKYRERAAELREEYTRYDAFGAITTAIDELVEQDRSRRLVPVGHGADLA